MGDEGSRAEESSFVVVGEPDPDQPWMLFPSRPNFCPAFAAGRSIRGGRRAWRLRWLGMVEKAPGLDYDYLTGRIGLRKENQDEDEEP